MVLPARLGFILVSVPRSGGSPQRVARFTCTRCDATVDVAMKPRETLSPDRTAKRARQHGWRVDAERDSKTLCPGCLNPRQPPTSNLEPEMATPIPIPLKPPAALTPTVSSLASTQRVKIRGFLDRHFDDSIGCYLDGMSDQRIAETLDVPRILVEQMREAAYGPIRISPEVMEMRAELDALLQEMSAMRDKAGKLEQRLAKVGA